MLKGIDPRLTAEILHTLRAMGHGDILALVDANFPAEAVARDTVIGTLLRMDNISIAAATQSVLSLMPLDTFVDDHAMRMEVIGDAAAVPPVHHEIQAAIDAAEGEPRPMGGLDRFAFYAAARNAFAIVQTGEARAYGNVLLRKGVILAEG